MNLAGSLAPKNTVLVLDADPKHIAHRWFSGSTNLSFKVEKIAKDSSKLHKELRKYFDDYDFIIIDCPPIIQSKATEISLLVADLLIIPMIPSPLDVWASVAMQYMLKNAISVNKQLIARWLLNKYQPNTKIDKVVCGLLPGFDIIKFKTQIHLRTAYKQSVAINSTVHKLGKKAQTAIDEIESLAIEIKTLLEKGK